MNTNSALEIARLVAEHIDLPRRVASTVYPRVRPHVELDELVALGNQGLAEAAQRYDARLGRFETYAWWRIHGAMVDGLRRQSPLPRHTWRKLLRARAANDGPAARAGGDGGGAGRDGDRRDDERVAAAVTRALWLRRPASLDQLRERGYDVPGATIEDELDRERLAAGLRAALAELPDNERALVERHYWEGRDLRAAGEELGMSKSWASRLHARALGRLRKVMEERGETGWE